MAKPISSSSPSTALPPIGGRMGPPGRLQYPRFARTMQNTPFSGFGLIWDNIEQASLLHWS
ncbi:hypothetical protein AB9M62_32025 [Bacillales bacterium AN1005]